MANFSIPIPDAALLRIRAAWGHPDPETGTWVSATAIEVRNDVKAYIQRRVRDYEADIARKAKENEVGGESW